MMTWEELGQQAAADELTLVRSTYSVRVMTKGMFPSPLFILMVGDLTDEDADVVLRRTLEATLCALKELPR
jgi:hypothetical protein